jgi:hypothetical protein
VLESSPAVDFLPLVLDSLLLAADAVWLSSVTFSAGSAECTPPAVKVVGVATPPDLSELVAAAVDTVTVVLVVFVPAAPAGMSAGLE